MKMENGKRKEKTATTKTKRMKNPAKKTVGSVQESGIKMGGGMNEPEMRSNDDDHQPKKQVGVTSEKLGVACRGNIAITNSNSNSNSNPNSDKNNTAIVLATARESGQVQTEQQQQQLQKISCGSESTSATHFSSNCDQRSLIQSSLSPNHPPTPPTPHNQMLKKTRSEPEPLKVKASESQLRKVKSENWNPSSCNHSSSATKASAAQSCNMKLNLTLCHSNDHLHQIHGQQQVSMLLVDEENKTQDLPPISYSEDPEDDDVDKLKPSAVALVRSRNNSCETNKEVQESHPKEKAINTISDGEGEGQHQLNKLVGSDDHIHNGQIELDVIVPKSLIKSKRVLSSSVTNFNLGFPKSTPIACPSTPTRASTSTTTPTSASTTSTLTPTSASTSSTTTSTSTPTSASTSSTTTSTRARAKPLTPRSVPKPALINSQTHPTTALSGEESYDDASNTPQPQGHGKLQCLVDLVMWRDVSKSAFIFGVGTFLIISSSYAKDFDVSLISVASYSSLLYLGLIFLYDSFMSSRGRVTYRQQVLLSEEEAVWLVKLLLPYLNESLLKLRALFCGDPAITMKLAVVLFVLARCGSSITIWNMVKFGFFGVFVIPKLCSSYSSQITAYANFWVGRFRDAWESCSHKKALAFAIFTLVWNYSSIVARAWAAFMLFVAFRYYQQSLITNQDFIQQPIGLRNVHVSQHLAARHRHRHRHRIPTSLNQKKEKKSF